MGAIEFTEGTGIPPRSFDEEFLTHHSDSEWWYCTGYLTAPGEHMFGFQFTLARLRVLGVRLHVLITSLTDLATGAHLNAQTPVFFARGVTTNGELLSVDGQASMTFAPNAASAKGLMTLQVHTEHYDLDLELTARKPPVRHCDDGVLQMGIPDDPKERTYYLSLTNLAVAGELVLYGERHTPLSGKAWFDRQGGTYSLTDRRTGWEWFSLRFFDDTEAMLFAFPQDDMYDGTWIGADGSYRRLTDYTVRATDVITHEGKEFSWGWTLELEGRRYAITPKVDGMFNLFFFEVLADIRDERDELVGYCFVELLPGVRNRNDPLSVFAHA